MGKGFPQPGQGRPSTGERQLSGDPAIAILRGVSGDAITLAVADHFGAQGMLPTVIHTVGFMTLELNLSIKFRGPVVADLSGMFYEPTVPMHRDHDTGRPVGHTTEVSDDGQQLSAAGLFNSACDDRDQIVSGRKNGFPWRPSVGLKLYDYVVVSEGQRQHINGRDFDGPFLWVKLSEFKESVIVSVPGDSEVDPKNRRMLKARPVRWNRPQIQGVPQMITEKRCSASPSCSCSCSCSVTR